MTVRLTINRIGQSYGWRLARVSFTSGDYSFSMNGRRTETPRTHSCLVRSKLAAFRHHIARVVDNLSELDSARSDTA
jgi:hypothetical protein